MIKVIYHIANEQTFLEARKIGQYKVESLLTEGFIHCSTEAEVINTANRHFKGKKDLVLLKLDESAIAAKVIHENTSGGTVLYPHIYGSLNLNAILEAYYFKEQNGLGFVLPGMDDQYTLLLHENHFLAGSIKLFKEQKHLCDKALQQIKEADIFYRESEFVNSIAILMQHMSGNMISRWTDFLTSDGEKPYRERDAEFEPVVNEVKALMELWEKGWNVLFSTLNSLSATDLLKFIYIRGEALTVNQAILRQIAHYAQHTGQIILLAKSRKGEDFQTLSIAKGMSKAFKPK